MTMSGAPWGDPRKLADDLATDGALTQIANDIISESQSVTEAAERLRGLTKTVEVALEGFSPFCGVSDSLQVGFVSECDRRGITSSAVRLVTGHQSDAMLNVYARPRSLFESSAGAFFEDERVTT